MALSNAPPTMKTEISYTENVVEQQQPMNYEIKIAGYMLVFLIVLAMYLGYRLQDEYTCHVKTKRRKALSHAKKETF
jgi:hypothetical protein